MPKTRQLLRREITYSEAKEEDVNILHRLGYYDKGIEFYNHLNDNQSAIKEAVAHHLGLKASACVVAESCEWRSASFNVCIPVTGGDRGFIIRFPHPYRVGEAFRPGNADEKIRCEAGTYA